MRLIIGVTAGLVKRREKNIVEMIPVTSSNVQAIGYEESTETLRVEFNNGSIYEYKNVPGVVFNELTQAGSVGAYLNRNIRYNYPYEKIG